MPGVDDLEHFDVIILGAGATGLWTATDLIEAGARVLVVHAPHGEGYSSTRNQGWLHSGGLYAAFNASTVAQDCVRGFARIRALADRYDKTLVSDPGFRYVFDSPDKADEAVRLCTSMGIAAEDCQTDPTLQGLFGRPVSVASIPDLTVDSSRLLRTLGTQLVANGLRVETVLSLTDIRADFDGRYWHVAGPDFSVLSGMVLVAAGPLIPTLVQKLCASLVDGSELPLFEVTETTVLGIPHLAIPSAVVCTDGGPHVIPYRSEFSTGATICVPFDNQSTTADAVHHAPDGAARDRVLTNIGAYMPGLRAAIDTAQSTFWYSCQKLIPAKDRFHREWRHNVFTQVAPRMFIAYAGKFSTAPVLAERIVQQIDGAWSGSIKTPGHDSLEIPDQPFRVEERAVREKSPQG